MIHIQIPQKGNAMKDQRNIRPPLSTEVPPMPPPAEPVGPSTLYDVDIYQSDTDLAVQELTDVIGWSLTDDAYVFSHEDGSITIYRWSACNGVLIRPKEQS